MKNLNFLLDVLSRISESIVDEVTKKRIALIEKQGGTVAVKSQTPRFNRALFIRFGAIAAAVLLVFSGLFTLFLVYDPNRPVYTGMTVSAPSVIEASSASVLPVYAAGAKDGERVSLAGQGKDEAPKEALLDVVTGESIAYYCQPNEEIYIHIHITNPERYEILSFTLNGIKYSSYMFEYGSNMDTLIVKTNVGDVKGVVAYTIDAIKYVDGERIRDVRMDGDKTVKIGVGVDEAELPSVTVSESTVQNNAIEFSASVTDTYGLIAATSGEVYALLYDDDAVYGKLALTPNGTTDARLVMPDKLGAYRYAVIAYYDDLSGNGMTAHILFVQTAYNRSYVLPKNVTVQEDGIAFELDYSADGGAQLDKIELIAYDTVVAEGDSTVRFFARSNTNGMYRLRLSYSYPDGDKRVSVSELSEAYVKDYYLPLEGELGKEGFHPYEQTYHPEADMFVSRTGRDIVASSSAGEPYAAYAIQSGRVTKIVREEGCWFGLGGNQSYGVVIEIDGGYELTYYGFATVAVSEGDTVELGTRLGELTSSASVHLTLKKDSEYYDPLLVMKR